MACSSLSSRCVTALGAIFTSSEPLRCDDQCDTEDVNISATYALWSEKGSLLRGQIAPTSAHYYTPYTAQQSTVPHPLPRTQAAMASMLWFITPSPASLSRVMHVITYMGGAISLMRTGQSDVPA